jgi:integrase
VSLQTHLFRRGAFYYHRIRVPLDLARRFGRKELAISLWTPNPDVARRRGHVASMLANRLFDRVRLSQMLTEDQIRSLTVEYYRELLRDDELWRVGTRPVNWKDDVEAREYLLNYFLVETDEELEKALGASILGPYEAIEIERRLTEEDSITTAQQEWDWLYGESFVDEYLAKKGITVAKGSSEYGRLVIRFLQARREALRVSRQRSEGNWSAESQDPLLRHAMTAVPAPAESVVKVEQINNPPIWELVDKFIEERRRRGDRPKPLGEVRTSLKWFIDSFGKDKAVESYTAQDLRAYKDKLLLVPARFTVLLKCEKIDEAIELNKARNLPTLDVETADKKRLRNVKSFFAWAEMNGYISANPAAKVVIAVPKGSQKRKKRDGFTIEQLNRIFRAPIYTGCRSSHYWKEPGEQIIKDHRYWLPLVALFSGSRKTEICQLDVSDVQEHRGIWCFNITGYDELENGKHVKNVHSDRLVPIHPELMRLGMIEYVSDRREAGETKLFNCNPGEGNNYDPFTKWFHRFRKSLGIDGERTVFHSFRHNFEQAMTDTGMNERLQFAIGGRADRHSVTSYAAPKPAQLFKAISEVHYDGLNLAHLYQTECSVKNAQ